MKQTLQKIGIWLVIIVLFLFVWGAKAQDPNIWLEVDDGVGQYDYIDNSSTSYIHYATFYYGYQNSTVYVDVHGSTSQPFEYQGSYVSGSSPASIHLSTPNLASINHISAWTAGASLDLYLKVWDAGNNLHQSAYTDELMLLDVQKQDISSNLSNSTNQVVLQFSVDAGTNVGRKLQRLWVRNDGTLQEGSGTDDINYNKVKLYYASGTVFNFNGTESSEFLYGDYALDPTNNERWGNDSFSAGGIPIPSDGTNKLLCYVVVENFNPTLTAERTAQFKIENDGMSLDAFGSSAQNKVRIDEKRNSTALPIVGPVTVSNANALSNGDYPTLKAAFDALNGQTQPANNILVEIHASTTETASAVLNPGTWTSVKIYPTTSGLSVSGALNGNLVELSGTQNVTFDGRVNATGSTKDLTISNTNNIGASATTFAFTNDASQNKIQYCYIKGSASSISKGVVYFSSIVSSGNSFNAIAYNDLTCSTSGKPFNMIYSAGGVTGNNSSDTIRDNNIYNFWNPSGSSGAVTLDVGNTSWILTGNNFFNTTTLTPDNAWDYHVIRITNTGTDYMISGNYIGGSTSMCGGSPMNKTININNLSNNIFYGIYLDIDSGSVRSNTIQNISWTNSGSAHWNAIHIKEGAVTVGGSTAADGNLIGNSSGTGSISVTGGSTAAAVHGIYRDLSSFPYNAVIRFNTIGSITTNNTNNQYSNSFYGILNVDGSTDTISDNLIGSKTTANSIQALSPSQGGALNLQAVYGINSEGGNVVISNNYISNLTNNAQSSNPANYSKINGIYHAVGNVKISKNHISNLKIAGLASTGSGFNTSVIGINIRTTTFPTYIGENTIDSCYNSNNSSNTTVIGIFYNSELSGTIEKNFIHSLTNFSSDPNSQTIGILSPSTIAASTTSYINNIISLSVSNSISNTYGIFSVLGSTSLFHNTITLSGTSSGTDAALTITGKNTGNIENNIFANFIGPGSTHQALNMPDPGNSGTIDYNDYVGGVKIMPMGPGGHDLTVDPLLVNASGTLLANYIPANTALVGTNSLMATIQYDIDGTFRCVPTMGAQENDTPVNGLIFTLGPTSSRCMGAGTVTYTATASNTSGIIYSLDATSLAAGNTIDPLTGAVVYSALWAGPTTVITATATGCGGPITATHIVIINNMLPVSVSIIANHNPFCISTPVTFTATPVNGGTAPAYQWFVNGNPVGVNNAIYSYTPANNDVVYCTLNSDLQCVTGNPATSAPITMHSNPLPNAYLLNDTVCVGGPINLSVLSGGTWISNNTSVATVTPSGTVTVLAVGFVTFTFTDTSTGCFTTTDTLTVLPQPVPEIQGPSSVCLNVPYPYSTTFYLPGNAYSWQVLPVGTSYTVIGPNSISVTWTSAGMGKVTVSESIQNASGCMGSDYIDVTVHAPPAPSLIYHD
jgi:hypothetical protein